MTISNRRTLLRGVAVLSFVSLLITSGLWAVPTAQAATMGQISWVQGRIKASTAADTVRIRFTVPTGVDASTDTITLTFDSGVVLASEVVTNFDFEVGDSATCSTANFTDETLQLNSGGVNIWGVDVTGQAITLYAPSNATTGEVTAGYCVQLLAGTNATLGGAGSASTVTNGVTANYDVDITSELGAIDDSGSGSISIIADDQVVVSATVDQTITFTVSDPTIGFGPITASTGRWATGDTNGTDASATTPTAAHTMTIATNAQTGYAITYNGATLTSGGNTINVASVDEDSDGTPGTEQYGLSVSTDGNATIATGYLRDTAADFTWVASTTTTVVSEIIATTTETISASYLGNIALITEAGAYSTTITYIASGVF